MAGCSPKTMSRPLFDDKDLTVNPFTDEHYKGEVEFLSPRRFKFHVEHVAVDWVVPHGRLDDYLNINIHFFKKAVPRLTVNGETMMSMTPMETQSGALAIHRAKGHVILLGLGIGYYALRIAAKPEVTKVTVIEKEQLVLDWFNRAYKDRPELPKIKVIIGDAREIFKGMTCDFCVADIYTEMAQNVLDDIKLFRKRNKIDRYHYWGYEHVVLDLVLQRKIQHTALRLGKDIRQYIRYWASTPISKDSETTMGEMRHDFLKDEILRRANRLLLDFPI